MARERDERARDPASFMDDPTWAKAIASIPPPSRTRHLPTHEDCSPIDVAAVQGHLRCGGTLGAMTGYEERPGQIEMAGAIAETFNRREHVMVEAGTGVGKSLAYLVPSILWAWTNDTPVVVSTATRNLQGQLMSSDIPRAMAILGDAAKDFKVALLKGRTNYLCLQAVNEFFSPGYWTLAEDEQAAMPAFIDWLLSTRDGDLDTFDGLDRARLSRSSDECPKRRCPFYRQCFVYKARQRAAEAHLVVANHALVLAEALSPGSGILPGYARLVLDEAHNLEACATEQLQREFSLAALSRIIQRLLRHHKAFSAEAMVLLRSAEAYLRFLAKILPAHQDRVRFGVGRLYWDDTKTLQERQRDFETRLLAFVQSLHARMEATEDPDEQMHLDAAANALVEFANEAAFVVQGEKATHAYWIERTARATRRGVAVRLVAAPLVVADTLHKILYDIKDSVVLLSATLRVGATFNYMMAHLGFGVFDDRARYRFLTAASPFDYLRQARVLAADFFTDPATNAEAYADEMARFLPDLFTATKARALVLFTSYEMMHAVAARVEEVLNAHGIRLVVQGERLSREAMTRALRANDAKVVVFGAQSFWEGVDVSGEALSCVVLTRLPFAQKGDPVNEARGERIVREGGNAFFDYALPEAVIKFRQGFGRLIRTKADRGIIVVTDPRLVTKNYGGIFRKSLPATVHTMTSTDAILSSVESFMV